MVRAKTGSVVLAYIAIKCGLICDTMGNTLLAVVTAIAVHEQKNKKSEPAGFTQMDEDFTSDQRSPRDSPYVCRFYYKAL